MLQKSLSHPRGFTLFELMLSMVVFSILMISVLESVANITVARTRSMNRITLLEELYFFSEKLATQIKEGGIIDYEEYWNRQVIGTSTTGGSGHYVTPTGFGNYGALGNTAPFSSTSTNYGNNYYYCRSTNLLSKVGTGGCLTANNSSSIANATSQDYTGAPQRYGEYGLQFTDYNGNADSDYGDEDGIGSIIGDEDDKEIGDGPTVLSGSTPELYLINNQAKERLLFRWTYKQDPNNPTSCPSTGGNGCLGNIEVLRLVGLDIGMTHSGTVNETTNPGAFDGNIDTWVCHTDWRCQGPVLPGGYGTLPTGANSEWVPLFPDYVNVKQISFSLYPQKDPWRSWAAPDCIGGSCASTFISPFIHPYVRMELTLGLAWERRKLISGDDPTIAISTTISLTNTTLE